MRSTDYQQRSLVRVRAELAVSAQRCLTQANRRWCMVQYRLGVLVCTAGLLLNKWEVIDIQQNQDELGMKVYCIRDVVAVDERYELVFTD